MSSTFSVFDLSHFTTDDEALGHNDQDTILQIKSINLTTGTNDPFLKYMDCTFILFIYKRDKTYNYIFIYTLLEFIMRINVLVI